MATTLLQGTNVDWKFKSIPQKFSSNGLFKQQQTLPRGKGLGGSAQMNYLLHFRGIPEDFRRWEKLVDYSWGFNEISRYMIDSNQDETCEKDSCDIERNEGGTIVDFTELSETKLSAAFLNAQDELNIDNLTLSLSQYNVRKGCRWSVFHEYLRPSFNRENLKIMTNTRVHKVLITNGEATGVWITPEGQSTKGRIVSARKEIIISAGAIQSPQLLQLSGIGPADELREKGVTVVRDSPLVGKNYFDHLNVPLFVSIEQRESVTKDKVLSIREWYKYLLEGKGVLSNTAVVGIGHNTYHNYGIALFGMGSADEKVLREIANLRTDVFRSIFPFHDNSSREGFILLSTCYQPKSRGEVTLKYNHVSVDPLVDPNYLKEPFDVRCIIKGIRLNVKLMRSNAFHELGVRIHWPKIQGCLKFGPFPVDFLNNRPNDKYLECIIRTYAMTAHHPGGTCAVGKSENSVLDSQMR